MLRHTLKLSLLALGLAATAPLAAQAPAPRAQRPMREWVAERPGTQAAVHGPRRHHRRLRHARRAHLRVRAHQVRVARGWRRF